MAIAPFTPVVPANPSSATANKIINQVNSAGAKLLETYNNIMTLVNANPWGLTSAQVYTALGTDDTTVVTNMASLVKTMINTITPGTINDSVPSGQYIPYTPPSS